MTRRRSRSSPVPLRGRVRSGTSPSLAIGLLYGAFVHQLAGDRGTVATLTEEILALSGQYGLPAYEGYATMLHDWAIGEQRRAHAIATGLTELGCKLALSYYGALLADNQAESGQFDAAIASIDHCLSLCRDNDEHFFEPELYRRRAMYEARRAPAGAGADAGVQILAGARGRAGEAARYVTDRDVGDAGAPPAVRRRPRSIANASMSCSHTVQIYE